MQRRASLPAFLAAFALVVVGCTHRTARVSGPPGPSFELTALVAQPQQALGKPGDVSGYVDSVELLELPDKQVALQLRLTSEQRPQLDPLEGATLLPMDHTLEQLESALCDAVESDAPVLPNQQYANIAMHLQAQSARLRALNFSLRAEGHPAAGKALATFATGTQATAQAFQLLAPQGSLENQTPVFLPDDSDPFRDGLLLASQALQNCITGVLAVSEQIAARTVAAAPISQSTSVHRLLAQRELSVSSGWQARINSQPELAEHYDQVAALIGQLADAVQKLREGATAMHRAFLYTPPVAAFAPRAILRCAYIGYNAAVLQECARRLEHVRYRHQIRIHGILRRGSLREELDVLWLEMIAISIDGITLDVRHADQSKASRFYDFLFPEEDKSS